MAEPRKRAAKNAAETPLDEGFKSELPKKIYLNSPYGFYEDDGSLKYWHPNFAIESEEDIRLLIERGIDWRE